LEARSMALLRLPHHETGESKDLETNSIQQHREVSAD
jgi:hypothetical protein